MSALIFLRGKQKRYIGRVFMWDVANNFKRLLNIITLINVTPQNTVYTIMC